VGIAGWLVWCGVRLLRGCGGGRGGDKAAAKPNTLAAAEAWGVGSGVAVRARKKNVPPRACAAGAADGTPRVGTKCADMAR